MDSQRATYSTVHDLRDLLVRRNAPHRAPDGVRQDWHSTVWNVLGLALVLGVPGGGGLWVARRVARAGLWVAADGVVVRNPLRTLTLSVNDVASFSPGVARGVGNGTPCPILKSKQGVVIGIWALGRDGLAWRMTRYLHEMEPLCEDLNALLHGLQEGKPSPRG
jgi:hypothetical protein